jgi:hypothetical protein
LLAVTSYVPASKVSWYLPSAPVATVRPAAVTVTSASAVPLLASVTVPEARAIGPRGASRTAS